MKKAFLALALGVSFFSSPHPASAQSSDFGQNQVIQDNFQWQVRSTEHFDIHYYEGSALLVPAAAEILERSYKKISARLGVTFTERKPLFLYANNNDFEESTIANTGDGTGGITEPSKDRFMVYNDGTRDWLDDVLTHELTHEFQYQVLVSGFWKSVRILKTLAYPLWMMEGMAEWSTGGLDDTTEEQYVRDAATSGGLIPLYKLEHFSALKPHQVTLGYKSGANAIKFLSEQYGEDKAGRMLKLFDSHIEASSVLEELIGTDLMVFDRKWREYEVERYARILKQNRLKDPWEFGVSLTTSSGYLPEFNTSPVLTPDGRTMAFLSTREGFPPQVVIEDLASRKVRDAVAWNYSRIENIPTGNFTNIARELAISADGRMLAFGAQKNHRQPLFTYDLKTRKLRRFDLPGLMQAQEPGFSPDGTKLVFSGMKDGLTDIYLLDLKTGKYSALTSDPQDDQSPSFAPDGESIVYSSEVEVPDSDMPYQRRLYRLWLRDGSVERLEDVPGSARDPVFSADGERILFTIEGWGFTDVYELDLRTHETTRFTRTVAGAFTPLYTPSGDFLFSSFRRGSIHIYRSVRERLLSEKAKERAAGRSATWFESAQGEVKPPEPVDVGTLPGMRGLRPAAVSTQTVSGSTVPFLSPSHPFHDSYSTDLFLPAAYYSAPGGLFWTSYYQGSDMLGIHSGTAMVSYNSGANYLNYQVDYEYTRYRPQLLLSLYGVRAEDLLDLASGSDTDITQHTQLAEVLYPLDRFERLEFSVGAITERQDYPDLGVYYRGDSRIYSASFVRDTVGGRYLVENRGTRLDTTFYRAVPILGGDTEASTISGEAQEFLPLGDLTTIALREYGADSFGGYPQGFDLGGLGGVRGYGRSTWDNVGTRIGVVNAEYRFPIVKNLDYYMWYIFPDFYFKAITGALFTDAGYAWNTDQNLSAAHWNTLRNSYGMEIRINTFILQLYELVVNFDYAQRTTSNGGIFYVYVGALY